MGNTPPTPTCLRIGNGDFPYQIQLGKSTTLYFKGRKVDQLVRFGLIIDSWEVLYKVDNSTCIIELTRRKITKSRSSGNERLTIIVHDIAIGVPTDVLEVNVWAKDVTHITITADIIYPEQITPTFNTTTNTRGVVTDTKSYFYGSGTRVGLLIWETKKQSKDDKPYTGTVAHYYVNTDNGHDVGISFIMKGIRASSSHHGHLDFDLDGPEQHPGGALLYMFNEVRRTSSWKPTYCPHCANKYVPETENDDGNIGRNNAFTQRLHVCSQNSRCIVDNRGIVIGDDNGNVKVYIDKLFYEVNYYYKLIQSGGGIVKEIE